MPLAISVMRKNLPMRSRVVSLSQCHSTRRLVRKLSGGGPLGVAYPLVCWRTTTAPRVVVDSAQAARGSAWRTSIAAGAIVFDEAGAIDG